MADEPEQPASSEKPAPRHRATRKSAESTGPARKAATRPAAKPKSVVEKAEAAVVEAVKAPVAAGTATPKKAVKPRSTNRATPHATGNKVKAEPKSRIATATGKVGGGWGAAAIAGGLAAAGAAAALFTLRGSTPKNTNTDAKAKGAHQPDGKDSSASFKAGIADEGTIPE